MASTSTQNVKVHEEDIDNDLLIEEVEKRALIYDKKLKEYSDSNLKIKAWDEISRIIFSTVWGTLSSQEKTEAGKLVQKRWKNLRACFSRELREQKSGQAATKRRKYKHFDQLLFLIPSMDTRETSGNADSVEEIACEEDRMPV
ncbi:uncharacterized protein LOC125058900 [Pieris napi]|uniref:uncharacterized protein LOC125058900 n=1 Tax=Pieris napi TaxID=78633 RepID=UPI001FBBA2AC|nr:uncharacterized protein LOC125058900 [Pieris napi]